MAANVGSLMKLEKMIDGNNHLSAICLTDSKELIADASSSQHLQSPSPQNSSKILRLLDGDPTMYEKFWKQVGEKATLVIPGWQSMSYYADIGNVCCFLEQALANQILRLHRLVGNAVTDGRYIVVGTGSSQLFQAVLYALSLPASDKPVDVVSVSPFYVSYPTMTDFLKSGLYEWAGDASIYKKDGPFIELVNSPSNPDGSSRKPVVTRTGGRLVHDLPYYWPQYTPISHSADHDIMLFSGSKCTGHAGTRIGWALVKDRNVAEKMVDFIVLNTMGVSRDSQLRAAKILEVVADGCEGPATSESSLFEFGYQSLNERWRLLRQAVQKTGHFTLPSYDPHHCKFSNRTYATQPAFAWLKCEGSNEDCEQFLEGLNILARGGDQFGATPNYVRVSLLDRDETMAEFLSRLRVLA